MCAMSQKRPLIRSTLVLAFERGKEEEEFKEKESKKKINALRLSSIIFVVALVYVVVVVVNSLEDNWEEFCLLFLCLTSLKKTREATFLCSKKKGENCSENTNNRIQQQKNELFSTIQKQKRRQERKKMNDAAAATFDAVSDGVSDVKDTVGKYVQFNANKTNFFIKLRKNLDVRFPGNYSAFVLCIYVSVVVVLY